MRPEIAAFQELETLVRNLGDQLASYRKRALTAESRCRTLEAEVANASAERERLLESLLAAKRALAEARSAPQPTPSASADTGPVDSNVDEKLQQENRELQELLAQARERTSHVVDRVRFLRQQMAVEK